MDSKGEDLPWPARLPQLKILDHQLRCNICYNYFDKPVMAIGCSHNFCSFCIRKHCTLQNCCPICNTELSDRMLKANHILDEIIKSFLSIKKFFLQSNTEEPTPGSPKRKSLVIGTKLDTPSKLPKIRVEEQQASNQSVNVEATTSIAQTPVLCPICNTSVVNNMINSHLDSCMKASSPQKRAPVRDPMPKLIYNLMTKKDLCKKLKLVGLSQQGDMGTLIQRHRKFTTLYNAECDNTRPRSDAELVRQIEKEEAAGKKLAQQQQLQQQQPRRRLEPEAADKWNRQYLEENRLQFQKLIDEIRQRRTVTAEDRQEVPIETEDDEVSILPHAPKVVEEISLIEDEEPTDQSSTEEKQTDSVGQLQEPSSPERNPVVDVDAELNEDTLRPVRRSTRFRM